MTSLPDVVSFGSRQVEDGSQVQVFVGLLGDLVRSTKKRFAFRSFRNLHITESSNCCKVIPILGNCRRFPTPRADGCQSIKGQPLRESWS